MNGNDARRGGGVCWCAKLAGRLERLAEESPGAPVAGAVRSSASVLADRIASLAPADSVDERKRLVGEGPRDWVLAARALGVDPEQALRFVDDERIAEIRRDVHQASNSTTR